MRIKNKRDDSIFKNYVEFGKTEIIADCIGPLIDISKIKDFREIEYVRFLTEDEISEELKLKGNKSSSESVRNTTKNELKHPKLAVRLIDTEMLLQLCRAKKFCSIKIVSTVPDIEVFDYAKKVLIDYSKQLIDFNPNVSDEEYSELEEEDFQHVNLDKFRLPGIIYYYKENESSGYKENSYRIAIDDDTFAFSNIDDAGIPSFQEWIGGIRENKQAERLKAVLDKRKHIYRGVEAIRDICKENKIVLNDYTIMNDNHKSNYYVYLKDLREQLDKRVKAIKHIIETGKAKDKPICVFLAGAPGTGKSYFVNCFSKYVNCEGQYPMTSLSGVDSSRFYDAIEYHVEQVYNTKRGGEQTANVAFLDEIDTKCNYFAFRFLMDAMTGSRTNENGVTMKDFKSGTVEDLVWFFAGSAGATRQEFMNQLKMDERKVIDFFDRIHFDIQLPEVSEPGQAILTLMSGIKQYWEKDELPTKISITVLLAFACTRWSSTRSIMTICRVAAAHQDAGDEIHLDLFEGIDTSEEFHKQCIYIKNHVHDARTITIEW